MTFCREQGCRVLRKVSEIALQIRYGPKVCHYLCNGGNRRRDTGRFSAFLDTGKHHHSLDSLCFVGLEMGDPVRDDP